MKMAKKKAKRRKQKAIRQSRDGKNKITAEVFSAQKWVRSSDPVDDDFFDELFTERKVVKLARSEFRM